MTTFPLFRKFPKCIRIMIWEVALHEPEVIFLALGDGEFYHGWLQTPPLRKSRIAAVNKEARAFADLVLQTWGDIHVNFEADILLWADYTAADLQDLREKVENEESMVDYYSVGMKKLAIPAEEWSSACYKDIAELGIDELFLVATDLDDVLDNGSQDRPTFDNIRLTDPQRSSVHYVYGHPFPIAWDVLGKMMTENFKKVKDDRAELRKKLIDEGTAEEEIPEDQADLSHWKIPVIKYVRFEAEDWNGRGY